MGLALIFALGGYTPLYGFFHRYFPLFTTLRYPVKFLFLFIFYLCLAAGLGLDGEFVTMRVFAGLPALLLAAGMALPAMAAEDFRPLNRLGVARRTVGEFVRGRPADRIGLVVFAGLASTRCPLTLDHAMLVQFLEEASGPDSDDLDQLEAAADRHVRAFMARSGWENRYRELRDLLAIYATQFGQQRCTDVRDAVGADQQEIAADKVDIKALKIVEV